MYAPRVRASLAALTISAWGAMGTAVAADAPATKSEPFDIVELMMKSTLRIEGRDGSTGTGFLLIEKDYFPILVTAAHVLDRMPGSQVIVTLRRKTEAGWIRQPVELAIRRGRDPIYVRNPDADVAAIYVKVDPSVVPAEMFMPEGLVDDDTLMAYGVRTGHEAFILSYPLGTMSNDEGFPILRGGHIATYPIYPMRYHRAFALDCEVHEGDYGAPVIVRLPTEVADDRTVKQREQEGLAFVIGLVGKPPESTSKLRVVTVVPAPFILDTIGLLRKSNSLEPMRKDFQRNELRPSEMGSLMQPPAP